MKVTRKILPGSKIELTITDSNEAFEKARKNAIAEASKHVQVKGFRKGGKVPEDLIIKEIGAWNIDERAVNAYINSNYQSILKAGDVIPVSAGVITNVASLSPLSITIEVEVLPTIAIDEKKMNKIKLKKTNVSVTKEEVEQGIADIEKRFTHFHNVWEKWEDGFEAKESTIALGDRVTLDTQGFDKQGWEALPETKVQSFALVIGSGQFIPGFEEKLIGHKVGDVVEFDITFPKDYHSEAFKNRKVFFMTTIFKLEKPHTPTWDEAFIERLRGVKTDINGFKDILEKEILGEKERRARESDETKLLEELEKIATYELGEGILEREGEIILNEHKSNLESQWFSLKMYLEHIKMDEERYKKEVISKEARRRLWAELLLKTVREMKKIEASEEEVTIEIAHIISEYSNEDVVKRLREKLVPGDTYYEDIKMRLAYRKVVDSFFE